MNVNIAPPYKKGFSLVENLLSLFVIALIVPTALAAMTLSLDFKRTTQQEAKSIEVAQYVFNQLPYAWKPELNILFPHAAPHPFPSIGSSDTLHVLFTDTLTPYDEDLSLEIGDTDWLLSDPSPGYTLPSTDASITAGYIVTITQEELTPTDLGYNTDHVRRFILKVAHPAGAPAAQQKTYTYSRLFRK